MHRKLAVCAVLLGLVLGAGYTAFWFYLRVQIETGLAALFAQAETTDVRILGNIPPVTGFPLPPRMVFSGAIASSKYAFEIPVMEIRGYFLPGTRLHISLPLGMKINGALDPEVYFLHEGEASVRIPLRLPRSIRESDVRSWQAAGHSIDITHIRGQWSDLRFEGKGWIGLSGTLQPQGVLESRVMGHNELLRRLTADGHVPQEKGMMAGAAFGLLSRRDAATGELYMDSTLSLRDGQLMIGPVRIAALAPVFWPADNRPAPPE